jgi:hypothetical protein
MLYVSGFADFSILRSIVGHTNLLSNRNKAAIAIAASMKGLPA